MSRETDVIETMFNIQDKGGLKVPFKLNKAQRFFDANDNAYERTRILIAKARQKGFSSVILGKFSVRCLGKEGTRAVCVSHEATATQRLFDKTHYFLKHFNGPKPIFGRNSRTELYFEKMESTYYIGTAGAKAFGRGDTVTDLHCSEYAFWEDPVQHFAGLFQAVPWNGRIYIESTGNGRHNDFYYMWKHAEDMGYKRLFYPWYADLEYVLPLPISKSRWIPDLPKYNSYMQELKEKFKLSDNQMFWYESKLKEIREDISSMQQEYPSTPEECFQATGGSIFPNAKLSTDARWIASRYKGYYVNKLEGHPIQGYHYVMGGDPSGGTGHDDASWVIFCVETFEQVFEFANNKTNPIAFGELGVQIGKDYNDAFIATESNNHGAAVIPYLKENYKHSQLYKRTFGTKTTPPIYGWNNTETTKHALVGTMQEMLDTVTFYGRQTVTELEGFEENEKGKMEGDSDNTVIAVGLCFLGLKKFEHFRREYLKPIEVKIKKEINYLTYTLDDVLKDLNEKKEALYPQVGEGYPFN